MIKILYALIAFTIFSGLMILQSNAHEKPAFSWCNIAKYKSDCCREVSAFMTSDEAGVDAESYAEAAEVANKVMPLRRVNLYKACLND